MRLVMKRLRLMELLLATDVARSPVFQVRHEHYRLARGDQSLLPVPGHGELLVMLELERVPEPAVGVPTVVLCGRDVEGGEGQAWRGGRRVEAL